MYVILRRFAEFSLIEIMFSFIITGLYEIEVLSGTQDAIKFATLIAVIIYIAIQVIMMRHCFYDLSNRYDYYLFNFTAYMLFIIFSLIIFFFGGNYFYTWLFEITKFIHFINFDFDIFYSLIVFHLVILAAIALAPVGMGWVFVLRRDRRGEEELMPTLLDMEDIN